MLSIYHTHITSYVFFSSKNTISYLIYIKNKYINAYRIAFRTVARSSHVLPTLQKAAKQAVEKDALHYVYTEPGPGFFSTVRECPIDEPPLEPLGTILSWCMIGFRRGTLLGPPRCREALASRTTARRIVVVVSGRHRAMANLVHFRCLSRNDRRTLTSYFFSMLILCIKLSKTTMFFLSI